MADITKCKNEECKIKESCYRYTAIANEFYQSYALFTPQYDVINNITICDNFLKTN